VNALWIRVSTFCEVVRGAQADDTAAKDNNVVGILPAASMVYAWHIELYAGQIEG
jgi:hypothetical protein